jgi:hypothetical protein
MFKKGRYEAYFALRYFMGSVQKEKKNKSEKPIFHSEK